MVKGLFDRRVVMTLAIVLMVCLTCSSCETLKKKFTRKKKADQAQSAEFQPVLEPQDYPAPDKNPKEIYKQHYALVKSWYRDLWAGISERSSDGSVKYSIKQLIDHIDQMKPLLSPEKAKGLVRLEDLLTFYKTSLEQPRHVRNYSRIQSDLRAFDRMLRHDYRFDAVKADLGGQ
jgi:hypothetical protein